MKMILSLFLILIPGIAFANYGDQMGKSIRLEAIQKALESPVAEQINKEDFITELQEGMTMTDIDGIVQACAASIPKNLTKAEKIDVCQNFLIQVISEHNKIVGKNALPKRHHSLYPTGDKIYSSDNYYMAKTDPEIPEYYGIFENDGYLTCLLSCTKHPFTQLVCGSRSYGPDVAFACEPKDASLEEYYTDRFLVSRVSEDGGKSFYFDNQYLPSPLEVDTTDSVSVILSRYRDYNAEKQISETAADFINCEEFLGKTLSAKTYTYVPEKSELYQTYLRHINNFNNRFVYSKEYKNNTNLFGSPWEYDHNVCKELAPFYTSVISLEKTMETANSRIEQFLAIGRHGVFYTDESMINEGRSIIVNKIDELFNIFYSVNDFTNAGYVFDYERDCTETLETLPAERYGTYFGFQTDIIHVQCNVGNRYTSTVIPVLYDITIHTDLTNPNKKIPHIDHLTPYNPDALLENIK